MLAAHCASLLHLTSAGSSYPGEKLRAGWGTIAWLTVLDEPCGHCPEEGPLPCEASGGPWDQSGQASWYIVGSQPLVACLTLEPRWLPKVYNPMLHPLLGTFVP